MGVEIAVGVGVGGIGIDAASGLILWGVRDVRALTKSCGDKEAATRARVSSC